MFMKLTVCLVGFYVSGAKLPLYTYKRVDSSADEVALGEHGDAEVPMAFLDSLMLGEVDYSQFMLMLLKF